MADLAVSLLVLAGIVLACELARRASARLLFGAGAGTGAYAAELISTLQLCACTHELKLLGDAGVSQPPPVALALTYATAVVQAFTARGATCNPSGALERFLRRRDGDSDSNGKGWRTLVARVACQFVAAVAARDAVRRLWARGLSELHARHSASAFKCASPVGSAPLLAAAGVEMACAFAVHATASCTRGWRETFRVHAVAAVITAAAYAGGSITGSVTNPALAFSTQFPCSGSTFTEYSFVYWMGPVLGMAGSVLLFDKFIPGLSAERRSHEEQIFNTIQRKRKKK
ncbi:aquaporin-11 [Astyanax mexicanus]|uniref:aquaporin-11 n=1 Tax=Astyanax mexicanus TaxID=7994 RepID=UPI0020CAED9A|nr:aquaporin-11 [Astyanax mexicanus]